MIQGFQIAIATVVLCLGAVTAQAAPSRADVAGTYTATVGGNSVDLVLHANGTGSLGGESGRWSLSGQSITLSDGAGESVTGTVRGNTLTFTIEGTTLRFVKKGGAANTNVNKTKAASAGEAFKPTLVKGRTIKPRGTGGSFRLPRGWKHGLGKGVDGKDAYNLTNKAQTVVISLGRTMLSGSDRTASPDTLIEAALAELLEGASVSRVVPTETFSVGRKPAGRVVVRASVDGTQLEGYLGVVIVDGWAFSVVGLYKAADAKEGRGAADTILATLKVKAPKANKRLMAKVGGCWEYYQGRDSSQTQDILRLASDGTYSRSYLFSVANVDPATGTDVSGASNISKTAGTWTVVGTTLVLFPEGKDQLEYDVGFRGQMMVLGSRKYLPKSC